MFYLVGVFDLWTGIRTLLISSLGAYSIATHIQGPYMPWIGFIFLMGHMAINHIHRQFVNNASLVDITGRLRSTVPTAAHPDYFLLPHRGTDGVGHEGLSTAMD